MCQPHPPKKKKKWHSFLKSHRHPRKRNNQECAHRMRVFREWQFLSRPDDVESLPTWRKPARRWAATGILKSLQVLFMAVDDLLHIINIILFFAFFFNLWMKHKYFVARSKTISSRSSFKNQEFQARLMLNLLDSPLKVPACASTSFGLMLYIEYCI